jgi:hypothetical protein
MLHYIIFIDKGSRSSGSGVGGKFSILVKTKDSIRKYAPSPDFILMPREKTTSRTVKASEGEGFYPIFLGEAVSNREESDRYRMLLQLAVCARWPF